MKVLLELLCGLSGFAFLGFIIFKFAYWVDAETECWDIERRIPLSLFLASYEREPGKWSIYENSVWRRTEHEHFQVSFPTISERIRYRAWYKKKVKREEREQRDEMTRKLMDSIAEGYVESFTVESKPVEAEVPAKREWSVKRCGDCRYFWMQNQQQRSGYCSRIYPARINQYAYDIACEAFVDAKERKEAKS